MNIAMLDSNRVLAEALGHSLKNHGHQLVATFTKPIELLEKAETLNAEVLIANLSDCSSLGPKKLSDFYALAEKLKIIAFIEDTDLTQIQHIFNAGIAGCISNGSSLSDLLEGIEKVSNGHKFLSHDLNRSPKCEALPHLTPQEKRVLALLTQGHSAKEIAELLKISVKTVYIHRARLIQKLGTKNLITLKRKASELGIWLNHHEQVTRFA
jgi:two-component system uhpT operon response regulator UhpA